MGSFKLWNYETANYSFGMAATGIGLAAAGVAVIYLLCLLIRLVRRPSAIRHAIKDGDDDDQAMFESAHWLFLGSIPFMTVFVAFIVIFLGGLTVSEIIYQHSSDAVASQNVDKLSSFLSENYDTNVSHKQAALLYENKGFTKSSLTLDIDGKPTRVSLDYRENLDNGTDGYLLVTPDKNEVPQTH